MEIEDLIEKAKKYVWDAYDHQVVKTQRSWNEASVDHEGYRIRIIVLSGSPPKGYVIANYGRNTVQAFNAWDKKLKLWELWREQSKQEQKHARDLHRRLAI
jgi:hypothetical protein